MADRTVVRQRSVVTLGLGFVLALASVAPGSDDTTASPPKAAQEPAAKPLAKAAAEIPLESRPYKIRAWVSVDPRARVDASGRAALIVGWKVMMARFVGAPWNVEIAEGDGPLATNRLEDVTPEMVTPEASGFNKAWLIRVEPSTDGLSFAGREFDTATGRIGLLCRRSAPVLADGPRALLQLALDIFAPSAEIAEKVGGSRRIRVQGALLPAADPIGQVVSAGSVFRGVRIFLKPDPDGGIQLVTPIKKAYLRVESVEGGVASCTLISQVGDPFDTKVIGRQKMVVVGLKPASIPTKIQFLLSTADGPAVPGTKPEPRPAAGYDVVAIPVPDGSPRAVGTTDREGRIVLEPGFSGGLVKLRMMAAGIEPLIEFPIMPGEQVEENVIANVDSKPWTVTAESEMYGLRDEIIDLIAVRHRLEAKLKARTEADKPNWDDVKYLLEDFRALPNRANYEERLKRLDASLTAEQKQNTKRKIRTVTAQKLIADTQALIDRYLDDESFEAFARGVAEYNAQAGAAQLATKALPKAPPLPMTAAAGTPGSIVIAPVGAGFRIAMPGSPSEQTSPTPDGSSTIKSFVLRDQAKGMFAAEYWDYPVALNADDVPRVIDSERDRQGAAFPNGKILRETAITIDGQPGKEIEWDTTTAGATAVPSGYVCRIVTVNARVFAIGFGGSKTAMKDKAAAEFFDSFHLTGRIAANAAGGTPPSLVGTAKAATPPAAAPRAPAPAAGRPKANPGGGGSNPF